MALTTVSAVKTHLGISDTSEDAFLTQLLAATEAAFKKLIDRDIEAQTYTEYADGNDRPALLLREYPVLMSQLTGTTTSGSAVVTGLSSTSALAAGMPVTGTGVPVGATVGTVDSATQVTLSAAATASGSVTITFGLAVWLDPTGAWGQASGAFADGTHLAIGVDYALVRDGRGGLAEAGRLYRIGGVWPGRWTFGRGLLAPRLVPGAGNVKVSYRAGFLIVPADIQLAVWQTCAELRHMRGNGRPLNSESFDGYSASWGQAAAEQCLLAGSRQQVVARYRRVTPRMTPLG